MIRVKNYNFSFDLEFAKGINFETKPILAFKIRIESRALQKSFVIELSLEKNRVQIIYWFHNANNCRPKTAFV